MEEYESIVVNSLKRKTASDDDDEKTKKNKKIKIC